MVEWTLNIRYIIMLYSTFECWVVLFLTKLAKKGRTGPLAWTKWTLFRKIAFYFENLYPVIVHYSKVIFYIINLQLFKHVSWGALLLRIKQSEQLFVVLYHRQHYFWAINKIIKDKVSNSEVDLKYIMYSYNVYIK